MGAVSTRLAIPEDSAGVARLLRDFNSEFETSSPPLADIEERTRRLLADGSFQVILAGEDPDGLALVSFRRTVWDQGPAALLEELYVVPAQRGKGIGRALMDATIALARDAGCAWLEVTTGESDTAARGLYESLGFTNIEDSSDRPRMLYYELEF